MMKLARLKSGQQLPCTEREPAGILEFRDTMPLEQLRLFRKHWYAMLASNPSHSGHVHAVTGK